MLVKGAGFATASCFVVTQAADIFAEWHIVPMSVSLCRITSKKTYWFGRIGRFKFYRQKHAPGRINQNHKSVISDTKTSLFQTYAILQLILSWGDYEIIVLIKHTMKKISRNGNVVVTKQWHSVDERQCVWSLLLVDIVATQWPIVFWN